MTTLEMIADRIKHRIQSEEDYPALQKPLTWHDFLSIIEEVIQEEKEAEEEVYSKQLALKELESDLA